MEAASSVTKEQKDTDFFELFKHIFFLNTIQTVLLKAKTKSKLTMRTKLSPTAGSCCRCFPLSASVFTSPRLTQSSYTTTSAAILIISLSLRQTSWLVLVCVCALCSHAPAGRPPVCAPRPIPMINVCFRESLHVCVFANRLQDNCARRCKCDWCF